MKKGKLLEVLRIAVMCIVNLDSSSDVRRHLIQEDFSQIK